MFVPVTGACVIAATVKPEAGASTCNWLVALFSQIGFGVAVMLVITGVTPTVTDTVPDEEHVANVEVKE